MAEHRHLSDTDLERRLAELGAWLDYPSTPHLTRSVGDRLRARPRSIWASLVPVRRGLALAALALLVLAGAVLAVSPDVRTAVADRLGLRGIVITHEPAVPAPPITPTPAPISSPAASIAPRLPGDNLRLGVPVSLDEAQARVRYRILRPSLPELSAADAVFVGEPPAGGQVSLVYRPRSGLPASGDGEIGLLLTQFQGGLEPGAFGKLLGPGTRLEEVTVNGARGFWIEGRPHAFFYRDAGGQIRDETLRLAGNTLLWEQGGLTLRVESALSKEEALRVAESVS